MAILQGIPPGAFAAIVLGSAALAFGVVGTFTLLLLAGQVGIDASLLILVASTLLMTAFGIVAILYGVRVRNQSGWAPAIRSKFEPR